MLMDKQTGEKLYSLRERRMFNRIDTILRYNTPVRDKLMQNVDSLFDYLKDTIKEQQDEQN